ncbi:MAG: hypothetical protein LH470_00175 [Lysobacter sp.]|nr:hypothetical protein [Lysobacter sp.]
MPGDIPLELDYLDPDSPVSMRLKGWLNGATKVSARQLAALPLDLSTADRRSPGFVQFKAWVDKAVDGKPDSTFRAADAALMSGLTTEQKYCDLAVSMLGQQIDAQSGGSAAGAAPAGGESITAPAPMLSDLALTLGTCDLDPRQRTQWLAYAKLAIRGGSTVHPPQMPPDISLRGGSTVHPRQMLYDIPLDLTYVDRTSPAYTRFKSWVDSAVNGSPGYAFEATDAAIMSRLTDEPQYCGLAVQMVEQQVVAAETAIAAGGRPAVAADSYLEVGTMISDVALTLDTCYRVITTQQERRWLAYAEQAVWNVWNHGSAQWGGLSHPWSGWSVDNPGNNYHYSFLEATMYRAFLKRRGQNWIFFLRDKKMPPLQTYFSQLPGGGSREGTGYGAAFMRLFFVYRLWRDAAGMDLANANPHVTDSIHYWVHATVPTLDRFAPIGDQSRNSVPELFDYHRRLVLEARQLTNVARAREIASWWLGNISVPRMTSGFNFRHDLLPAGTGGTPPTELVYHASGTGLLFARTGWDDDAMWLSFIAGPYNESHAHQDQGSFTLFAQDWLAVTENIWSHSGISRERTCTTWSASSEAMRARASAHRPAAIASCISASHRLRA